MHFGQVVLALGLAILGVVVGIFLTPLYSPYSPTAPAVAGPEEQLTLPTRPPRARARTLADTIELVSIGHYDSHRRDIVRKLGDAT